MMIQQTKAWITIMMWMLSVLPGSTQETNRYQLTIRQAPFGLYIDLGKVPASGLGYEVFRKTEGQADFERIGVFAPAPYESDFAMRLASYARLLKQYSVLKPELVSALWQGYRGTDRDNLRLHGELPFLDLATGITFADTTASDTLDYMYRVLLSDGTALTGGTKTALQQIPRFSPVELYETDAGYSKVTLQWKSLREGAAPDWTVWRKQVGADAFQQVDPERGLRAVEGGDSLVYVVVDSLLYSGVTYDYYLQLQDVLGNQANQSDTLRIEVGGRKNVPTVYDLDTQSDSIGIRLVWKLPAATSSLRSLLILRSDNYDNGYELIASVPATDTAFVDQGVKGGVNYFYQLIVEGDVNFSRPTARVSGMFYPPHATMLARVYEIQANVQPKSISLSWQYTDKDIAGFRMFRSLAMDGNYEQVGDLMEVHAANDTTDYVYIDSSGLAMNTMYYYKVAPVSRTFTNGYLSDAAGAMAAGIQKITTPQGMRGIFLSDTTVLFSWTDLQRSTPGIAGYLVYRKTDAEGHFTEDHRIAFAGSNEFVDTLGRGEVAYYALRSRSVNGERSEFSAPVTVTARRSRPVPPGSFRGYAQDQHVLLTWDGESNGTIMRYNIYRAVNDEAIELLTQVAANSSEQVYLDASVKSDNRYYYYIVAEHISGALSDRTNEVLIIL